MFKIDLFRFVLTKNLSAIKTSTPNTKTKFSITKISFLILCALIVVSCHNIFTEPEPQTTEPTKSTKIEKKQIVLGEKLKNPYSLKNMKKAMDTMVKVAKTPELNKYSFHQELEKVKIQPTDFYVRFLPKDTLELDLIQKDTTLYFTDYPLDYKLENHGETYHDPSVPKDQITWQYTVVKPNYVFPSVKYEILDSLFLPRNSKYYSKTIIPESENSFNQNTSSAKQELNLLDGLEDISLYLTGNATKEVEQKISAELKEIKAMNNPNTYNKVVRMRNCWWLFGWHCSTNYEYRPAGTVKYYDSTLGYSKPLEGARVEANYWFFWSSGITDSNGYYECDDTYKYHFSYRIIWARDRFKIIDSRVSLFNFGVAKYGGPWNTKYNWNLTIKGGRQEYIANIFRGAYRYCYGYIPYGLRRPSGTIKIRADFSNGTSHYFDTLATTLNPVAIFSKIFAEAVIKKYKPYGTYKILAAEIFGTTIHELAHSVHQDYFLYEYNIMIAGSYVKEFFRQNKQEFNESELKYVRVLESYANGVEWELTNLEYKKYNPGYSETYTAIAQNLMDSDDGLDWDEVSGFSIVEIEHALRGARTWNDWKENLKAKRYSRKDKDAIERLFNEQWNNPKKH